MKIERTEEMTARRDLRAGSHSAPPPVVRPVAAMFGFSEARAEGPYAGGSGRFLRRRLLEHCFDEFGGGHEHTLANGNNVTDLTSHDGTNWEPVVTGVHADPVVVRLVYWLVFVVAATLLLVFMLTVWPPPDRVFPRKKPVAKTIPWCCMGRLLGYGVIDWREGKLTPFPRYFKERHELISLFTGDMNFITRKARVAHFMTGVACTASLSMGLVDLESGRVTGDFWLVQIWVFGALFVFEIVLGIALRVSAVGVSERALAAGSITQQNKMEASYFVCCFFVSVAALATSITFVHVMDEGGGCGDGLNTFLAYSYIFGMYELFSWFVFHPIAITSRWLLGRVLLKFSVDASTDEETMACIWPKSVCGCKPQPSAAVDCNGVASYKPVVFSSDSVLDDEFSDTSWSNPGHIELQNVQIVSSSQLGNTPTPKLDTFGLRVLDESPDKTEAFEISPGDAPESCASPTEKSKGKHGAARRSHETTSTTSQHMSQQHLSTLSRHSHVRLSAFRQSAAGMERELVLGWKRASAADKVRSAEEAKRIAFAARREADDLRTALALAEAAEAEAAAASAAAEAASAEARAEAAEAKALRDALPKRRTRAPEMHPPTPQSIGSSRSGYSPFSWIGGRTPGTPMSATPSSAGYGRGGLPSFRPPRPTPSPCPGDSSSSPGLFFSRLRSQGTRLGTPGTFAALDGDGGVGGGGSGDADNV